MVARFDRDRVRVVSISAHYTRKATSVSLRVHPDLMNVYTINGTGSDKAFAAAVR